MYSLYILAIQIEKGDALLHGGNSDTIGVGVFFRLLNEYAKLVG